MTLTRRRRSKLFALRNSIGGAHLRGYAVSLGGVLRPKLPVRLLRYPFIVKSSLPAASRSSQDIRRSVGSYRSRRGSRSGNGSRTRCEHLRFLLWRLLGRPATDSTSIWVDFPKALEGPL